MRSCFMVALILLAGNAFADGPADNIPDKVRRIPPPGIKIAQYPSIVSTDRNLCDQISFRPTTMVLRRFIHS